MQAHTPARSPYPREAGLSGAESRDAPSKVAGLLMGPAAAGGAFPAFIKSRYSRSAGLDDARSDDGTRPAGGEMRDQLSGGAETCFRPSAVLPLRRRGAAWWPAARGAAARPTGEPGQRVRSVALAQAKRALRRIAGPRAQLTRDLLLCEGATQGTMWAACRSSLLAADDDESREADEQHPVRVCTLQVLPPLTRLLGTQRAICLERDQVAAKEHLG